MKNILKKLLCWIGFHYWIYINEDDRKCIRCKKRQYQDNYFVMWFDESE